MSGYSALNSSGNRSNDGGHLDEQPLQDELAELLTVRSIDFFDGAGTALEPLAGEDLVVYGFRRAGGPARSMRDASRTAPAEGSSEVATMKPAIVVQALARYFLMQWTAPRFTANAWKSPSCTTS